VRCCSNSVAAAVIQCVVTVIQCGVAVTQCAVAVTQCAVVCCIVSKSRSLFSRCSMLQYLAVRCIMLRCDAHTVTHTVTHTHTHTVKRTCDSTGAEVHHFPVADSAPNFPILAYLHRHAIPRTSDFLPRSLSLSLSLSVSLSLTVEPPHALSPPLFLSLARPRVRARGPAIWKPDARTHTQTLREYRALLREYRALLREYRALLWE